MSAQTCAVVVYDGETRQSETGYAALWRARLKIQTEVVVEGRYAELECDAATWPDELLEARREWRRHLSQHPAALRPTLQWHGWQHGWSRPWRGPTVDLQHPFWAEYRLIAYCLATGQLDKLRRLIVAHRRVGLAFRVLPLGLRRALRRAIG